MKSIIIILLLSINLIYSQEKASDLFEIVPNKSEKSISLTSISPITLYNEDYKLTLNFYRNIYSKNKEYQFKKGYIYIAVLVKIEDDTSDIASTVDEATIYFTDGSKLKPYSNFQQFDSASNEIEPFFSIENNIYKSEKKNKSTDEFIKASTKLIKSISFKIGDTKQIFNVPDIISEKLRKYIKVLGNYPK